MKLRGGDTVRRTALAARLGIMDGNVVTGVSLKEGCRDSGKGSFHSAQQ